MTELDAVRVRLDAARQMIAAAVRLAEGAADLLIEAGADPRTRATVDTSAAVFGLPVVGAVPGRVDKVTAYADPLASVPSSRLRD